MATGGSEVMSQLEMPTEADSHPTIPKTASFSPFKYPFSPLGSGGSPTLHSVFASPRNVKMAGTGNVCRKLQLPPCLDREGEIWEAEVEELQISTALQAQPLPPIIHVSAGELSVQDRISLYCDHILHNCKAEEVDEALCRYLSEKLQKKEKCIGVWKTNPGLFFHKYDDGAIQYVGVLVEVTWNPDVSNYLIARIQIAEPFSSNIANMQRELVDDLLEQIGHRVPLLEIYPTEGQDDAMCEIAQALDIVRFFFDHLWRDWDDEEKLENYAFIIEERIKLYGDIQDGNIPRPILQRFKTMFEKYRKKRFELINFQREIKDEPSVSDAVECWHKYYEVQMIGELLKLWESLQLSSHVPFSPRILRCKKGPRDSGEVVTHVVTNIMIADMVKTYSPGTLIKQHNNLDTALENCYCGDTVQIFPGEHKARALAILTDDITIAGIGKKEEIIITSYPLSDSFVATIAQNIKIINLTLRQKETFNGIVIVESGHLTLQNCDLQCDGTGICVLTGAALTMADCEISGSQGAGIKLYPGCGAILERNKIHTCGKSKCTDDLASIQGGGIKLKVIPAPVLKMSNNHIYNNNGYGIIIVQPKRRFVNTLNFTMEDAAAGDKKEENVLTTAIESLNLEIDSNKLEENSLGKVGIVFT
ncbi:testicular spindle-associated protein SHCBP1L [Hyla sarda]|uniref:testicular spindle-associated protein SHCBP1L n=1 Tax=Hyla sarda TaxID=327740 RepID=UPI0024C21DC3|nr:testicular spindle-associated protein SHCBP1L [Hyla sarda]